MTKKKLATMLTAMGLVGVVGIGGTLAYLTAETNEVVNTFAIGPGYTNEDGSVKIDIHENLVSRNEATGVFTQDTELTTNLGQKFENGTYSYTTYSTEGYTNGTYETVEGSTTEGIAYEGIVPGSEIPKNPKVTITPGDDGVVNSRLYVKVVGLDKMAELTATTTESGIIGMVGANWEKVHDIDDSNATYELDGYYLYKGEHTTGDDDSVILGSYIGTGGSVTTEPLFTDIHVPGAVTETQLEAAAVNQMLSNITVQAGIIQSDNISLGDSIAEITKMF